MRTRAMTLRGGRPLTSLGDSRLAGTASLGREAIVQVLLAAVARSAGRILITAVGWATAMIFGRVPEKRQISRPAPRGRRAPWSAPSRCFLDGPGERPRGRALGA